MPEYVRLRKWERWQPVMLTYSAGDGTSMPSAATATGVIDTDVAGAENLDLCASWKYGDAPAAPVTLTVARSVDGTSSTFESPVEYAFSDTHTASATRRIIWRIDGSDILQVVLTNGTGQAITNVSVRWRAVR